MMTDVTITKSVFFAASRETVWGFLTQKEKLALWFFDAEADLVEGEEYALIKAQDDGSVSKMCWGKVLEMDGPARLVYSFSIKPFPGDETTVVWELEAVHGGTKLSMTHERIGAAGEAALGLFMSLDEGWDEHFARLRKAAA